MPALGTAARPVDASPQKEPNLSSPTPQTDSCRPVLAPVGAPGEAERRSFQVITSSKDDYETSSEGKKIYIYHNVAQTLISLQSQLTDSAVGIHGGFW